MGRIGRHAPQLTSGHSCRKSHHLYAGLLRRLKGIGQFPLVLQE
jgi:hypothetical protein